MSRSNQTEYVANPATVDIEWSGSSGEFHTYDKDLKERVSIPFPLKFAVLDELSCVRGWYEDKKSNAFSNETHNLKNTPLEVRYFEDGKTRVLCEGLYADIKDRVNALGIKYNKVIYAMLLGEGGGDIVRIYLKGAAMGAWVNKTFKPYDGAVIVDGSTEGQKGAVIFKMPAFSCVEIDEEEDVLAVSADETLQAYFNQKPKEDNPSAQHTDADAPAEPELPQMDDGPVPF